MSARRRNRFNACVGLGSGVVFDFERGGREEDRSLYREEVELAGGEFECTGEVEGLLLGAGGGVFM